MKTIYSNVSRFPMVPLLMVLWSSHLSGAGANWHGEKLASTYGCGRTLWLKQCHFYHMTGKGLSCLYIVYTTYKNGDWGMVY